MGLTETEAREQGIEYEKAVFPWAASGRALSLGRDEGMTKLLFEAGSRRLLGAGIVGVNAGELIAETVHALEMGSDAEDIALTIHPHPTLTETIGFAAEMAEGTITDLMPPRRRRRDARTGASGPVHHRRQPCRRAGQMCMTRHSCPARRRAAKHAPLLCMSRPARLAECARAALVSRGRAPAPSDGPPATPAPPPRRPRHAPASAALAAIRPGGPAGAAGVRVAGMANSSAARTSWGSAIPLGSSGSVIG